MNLEVIDNPHKPIFTEPHHYATRDGFKGYAIANEFRVELKPATTTLLAAGNKAVSFRFLDRGKEVFQGEYLPAKTQNPGQVALDIAKNLIIQDAKGTLVLPERYTCQQMAWLERRDTAVQKALGYYPKA